MIRFRADYQRTIAEQDGDTVHALFYPTSGELFPGSSLLGGFALQVPSAVGTVREHADGTASAYTPDGELTGHHTTADAAIDILIKDDQARHNQ
jgi:hypothetical protein